MRTSARRTLFAVSAAAALTLSACGSDSLDTGGDGGSSSSAPSVSATKDATLADQVPAKFKDKGTLKVGTDASYPPNEFMTGGSKIQGMDIDLLNAALAKLGLKANYENGGFDNLILGVKSGKYDLSISSFTINAERMKQVSFTSYFSAGTQWVSAKGNPGKVNPADPCGKTITLQKGTVQVTDLQARSKKCTDAGKQPVKLLIEQEQTKATLNLKSGRAQAMAADLPVSVDAVNKNKSEFELLGENYDSAPYGIAYPKSEDKFGEVLGKAFEAMKKDGSYEAILKKWGTEGGAVDSFEVNPSAS